MAVRPHDRTSSTEALDVPAPRHSQDFVHCAPLFHEHSRLALDDPRRSALRRRLITEHLSLAENIAKRFSGRGEPFDDLLQVARTGLIHAVDRFDPHRGNDFLSFAVPTIMGEVRKHFRDTGWSMRVPRALKDLRQTLAKASTHLARELGRSPTPSELATHLDVDIEDIREGLLAAEAYRATSIDSPVRGAGGEATIAEQLAQDESGFEKFENHVALTTALAGLAPVELSIITMRFFDELTQSQIARRIGVSQMQVSRLLTKLFEQLRHDLVVP